MRRGRTINKSRQQGYTMARHTIFKPKESNLLAWSANEFEAKLREKESLYHINHPYQTLMNEGKMDRKAIQGWVANRFYYQQNIPMKDASILANCTDVNARRLWVQRIVDHDGQSEGLGGIEAWLQLGEAVGLSREDLLHNTHLLPGVRFAVDAYVTFASSASWQEAACSSLTELFAPTIHQKRLDNWPLHYPWIDSQGYNYFKGRLTEARRDVDHGLRVTLEHFTQRHEQEYALNILQFKLDILWSMLDSMWLAYVEKMPPYYNCSQNEVVL